jgi:hypothetical protein
MGARSKCKVTFLYRTPDAPAYAQPTLTLIDHQNPSRCYVFSQSRRSIMSEKRAVLAVYHPPKRGLPFLAVAIYSDGTAMGTSARTAAAAQSIIEDLASKAILPDAKGDRANKREEQ